MTTGPRFRASPTGRRTHLAKMMTWRLIATSTTVGISYLVIGDARIGATIGGIEATSKMALYYGHERVWARLTSPRRLVPAAPATRDDNLAPLGST